MKNPHPKNMQKYPEVLMEDRVGWLLFSPEISWFIYDFFKYDLNPYDKLIFYSYYINGLTLEQIADASGCTFQNIGRRIKNINKKIHLRWKKKESWRRLNDCHTRNK